MTIEQANAYFASLPEGFAPARQLQEALSAKAGRVDYLGVAGTAGKTTAAARTAAVKSPVYACSMRWAMTSVSVSERNVTPLCCSSFFSTA